jgi:hypothetical protein
VPLTDDQRAMLQLLLERGQSYEDIGSLLGLGVDDVRSRARAALTEIAGEDPDAEVALTDYLLGQSDPIGRADVARHLAENPEARDLAAKLSSQLRLLAPTADLPDLPEPRRAKRSREAAAVASPPTAAAGPVPGVPAGGFGAGLSARQRQLIAALVGGGALVIVIVLIAAGVFSGDDDGTSSAETATTPTGSTGTTGADGSGAAPPGATFAVLEAQDGSEAQGGAQFGRIRNRAYLQIDVSGLEPTPQGENYVIWLYGSDSNAFPLSFETVGDNGLLRGLAPIPAQVLAVLQQGRFHSIDVSLTDVSELRQALEQARQDEAPPPYIGESVLRGRIQGPGAEPASGAGGGSGGSGG